MITHQNLSHNLTVITNELKAKEDTVVVSWLPQYHDMGLIGSYLGVIYCGGSGFYMSPLTFLQRPMIWIEAISKYRGTHIQAPNFAYKLTARKFLPHLYTTSTSLETPSSSNSNVNVLNLSCIRHMINAAEPVDEKSIGVFLDAFRPFDLDRNTMFPTYGLAEHTVFVCSGGKQILTVRKQDLEMDGDVVVENGIEENDRETTTITTIVGCGYPSNQNIDVRIVDNVTTEELKEDKVGEIWVRSQSKAAGYFNKTAESEETFLAKLSHSITSKNKNTNDEKVDTNSIGYLRTGDLGFFHNSELFICGRLKDLIIVGGRNHYPQDIEATAEEITDKLRPGCSAAFTVNPLAKGEEKVALLVELREVPKAKVGFNLIMDSFYY